MPFSGRDQSKSSGQVSLSLARPPRTSSGARSGAQASSTAEASSVTRGSPAHASSAARNSPARNICGVCASHRPSRGRVRATRAGPPGASPARLTVSATGRASSPPRSSDRQASIRRPRASVGRPGRAASCTSTQAVSSSPASRRAARTVSARVGPPQGRQTVRGRPASASSAQGSPGATATRTWAMRGSASSARTAWRSMGSPPRARYCFGRPPGPPARTPTPAAGTRAIRVPLIGKASRPCRAGSWAVPRRAGGRMRS